MLQDSFAHAADDATTRALTEAQVEADRIVEATLHALEADSELLDATERSSIDAALADVAEKRAGNDAHALRAAVEALNRATADFAERRMDRSVRSALAGKRVDTLA